MAAPKSVTFSLCFILSVLLLSFVATATNVSHDGRAIIIDGKRRILNSGSIHYPRSTPQMWPDLIKKAKEGGLDAVETYVFWNVHEPVRREYDFTGKLDLVRFIKTIQDEGLYAILRIGPYVCAEWNYGGLPVWLHSLPDCEIRTNNDVYKNEMKNFTALIVDMMKEAKLFASQGGPIIIAQIENEYGNVDSYYGEAGKAYIKWCAEFAESLDVGVPWIMCQQKDAPVPMINTCNGWYCDEFTPTNPNTPKMWTENWTGWFKSWGGLNPLRTAEDVAFGVARFFQSGGTFQNYYMYHGGTNFGRTASSYITTSYDYDAPLDEYGHLNQPKWGHLKELHSVLKSMEHTLTYGNINTTNLGNFVSTTVYSTNETSSCFFANANSTDDATITYQGKSHIIPAWSVSILPDCKNEAYNTAKVNTQTTIKVKSVNNAEDEPQSLKWSWRPEKIDSEIHGKGNAFSDHLLEQKEATNDASDYLWYMTSVKINKDDPILIGETTLRINETGYILHAYVNSKPVGSQWASYNVYNYVFEKPIKLVPGVNTIALLSATVGFPNYGGGFENINTGVIGPVELVARKGDETVSKNLSNRKWSYKVGLHGMDDEQLFKSSSRKWSEDGLPLNRTMTWYKTTFKAPLGSEPVVVDLQGLGKGEAWVNGHSIGRYWPSNLAPEEGCSLEACDYRGKYTNNKCVFNCGKPTQRFYHVPRSFLQDEENTLVLFEEFGGNPSFVNFQTVRVGTVCANAYENHTVELSCQGRPISAIKFASFGLPQGSCGSFEEGTCDSTAAMAILQHECVGKESCSIDVSASKFGATACGDVARRLAVEAVC